LDELNLRDLIEILIRRKLLILITIVSVLLLVGIYVFLIQDAYYTAEVSVNVTRVREPSQEIQGDSVDELLESISAISGINQNNLALTLRSETVIQNALEDLELEDEYKVEEVANRISFRFSEETSLATIVYRDENSQRAADIANGLAGNFVSQVQADLSESSEIALDYIEKQLETEGQNLQEAQDDLQRFLSTPKGIDELAMELEKKVEQVSEYKVSITDLQVEQEALDQAIRILDEDLTGTDQKLNVTKSILEDPILRELVEEETDTSLQDLSEISYQEEIANELYTILAENKTTLRARRAMAASSRESKATAIEEIETSLVDVRTQLSIKQAEYREIVERIERRQEIHNKFSEKYEEIRITGSFEMGDAIISIASSAHPPSQPTTGNRRVTFAIAFILGLILGVVAAFSKEYWVNSKNREVSVNHGNTPEN